MALPIDKAILRVLAVPNPSTYANRTIPDIERSTAKNYRVIKIQ